MIKIASSPLSAPGGGGDADAGEERARYSLRKERQGLLPPTRLLAATAMVIGKIVKSSSHITYICQIFGPREVEVQPQPADFAFGRFVRIAVRTTPNEDSTGPFENPVPGQGHMPAAYVVGVIYDTILANPAFGVGGPRLLNETQVELFAPDYLSEKAVLCYVMVLGMFTPQPPPDSPSGLSMTMHGVPALALELGSEVETMGDEEIRAFHYFDNKGQGDKSAAYLHMGYVPHIIAQRNSLLPMVVLRIVDQLEQLFPKDRAILSIVKRNFAWRLKVETTG